MTSYIILYFLLINLIGLLIMKKDKQKAIKQQYRISEQTLWTIAFIGGAIGTTLGMRLFRHKTKHPSFKMGFPLLALLDFILFFYLIN
ncbi:DUF1294 domain-containing protein [Bacillus tuaregi]|uniref:DUF1294 domain-containing protein n=1 Tax=Bacillus tuaregi TaxID=1816695 RepID=UPI0008F8EE02|nr:DUF1294 domain-containing protein [Bacillus tuaregi]